MMRWIGIGFLYVLALLVFAGCADRAQRQGEETAVSAFASPVEALRSAGFPEVADHVLELKTSTVALKTGGTPASTRLGSSRIGGTPDLPPDISWPRFEGSSLSFIAQLNLDEVARTWPASPLPSSGTLYFFYDAEQFAWGFDPADRGKWAVIFTPAAGDELRETAWPADLPQEARFTAVPVQPTLEDDWPGWEQVDLSDLGLSRDEDRRATDIIGEFADHGGTIHKLFGHPDQIQGDMQIECQLVSHGLYCGDSSGYNDPRAEELLNDAPSWRLLLQIDSDDRAGMMWGDVGRLYFWIHERDLARRAFENAWLILQCY